jgi:hypothetical protein
MNGTLITGDDMLGALGPPTAVKGLTCIHCKAEYTVGFVERLDGSKLTWCPQGHVCVIDSAHDVKGLIYSF